MDIDSQTGKILYFVFIGFICIGICGMIALAVPASDDSNSTEINDTVSTQNTNVSQPAVKTLADNITDVQTENITEEEIIDEIPEEDYTPMEEDITEEEYFEDEIPIVTAAEEEPPAEAVTEEEEVLVPITQPVYKNPQRTSNNCAPATAVTTKEATKSTNDMVFKKIVSKNGYIMLDPKYAGMEVEVIIRAK